VAVQLVASRVSYLVIRVETDVSETLDTVERSYFADKCHGVQLLTAGRYGNETPSCMCSFTQGISRRSGHDTGRGMLAIVASWVAWGLLQRVLD
jgi:hypothetical protein